MYTVAVINHFILVRMTIMQTDSKKLENVNYLHVIHIPDFHLKQNFVNEKYSFSLKKKKKIVSMKNMNLPLKKKPNMNGFVQYLNFFFRSKDEW
jgi:hypothetical protein